MLKKEGYDVTATQSGQNALRMLEEGAFDIVLTDMKMEKVDGMQILKRCHELYPDTEVINTIGAKAVINVAVPTSHVSAVTEMVISVIPVNWQAATSQIPAVVPRY